MNNRFETEVLHSVHTKQQGIKSKATPIYQTSAFTFSDLDELEGFYQGEGNYLYSRVGNPNTDELGHAVAALEHAEDGVAASSGLAAILAGVLAVVKSGDHIVAADDVYGGSFHMLKAELERFGIETTFVPFADLGNVTNAIKANTKLLYTESITNPLLRVEKLDEVIALAKTRNLVVLVDNTFATPLHVRPYELGADLVVHSATKYIGGHSDVTSGVIVGRKELIAEVRARIVNLGANLSPFEAWLTCRGLKTLALRMKAQSENARLLAVKLRENKNIAKVYYPFEEAEQGFGAIVSVELAEHVDADRFFKSLGWVKIVPTLAGVETTVSHPLKTSHRALPPEAQAELGITYRLVRISVGIEHGEDIVSQFEAALAKAVE
ncbi:trans-sulfuration enzyme family protein [Mesobacillus thioparans]|uniref:trans-sulfuration enzyme family protein n=1 Tax=Mesobacillus thioparans TaxID=370439 RepID=UPI0039EE46E3